MSQSKQKENVMKYKLAYTSLLLLVYILGKNIPLYGIELSVYEYQSVDAETVLMQMISGDAYRSSVFTLGIFPFMISSILVQVAMAIRNLFSKTKISPKQVNRTTVMVTLLIAVLQALVHVQQLKFTVTEEQLFITKAMVIMEMITGVMFIMWLSDRNGKYGIGGRMILGLVNILERIGVTVIGHDMESLKIPLLISGVVMIITLVLEETEKRIPVQRVSIHNIYADKNYMAIKLNPIGVMPVMFTSAVFMLPQILVTLLGYLFPEHAGIAWWQENMTLTKPFGIYVYIMCEYLLTIVFALIMISPNDIMEQFLKSGDSIVNLHAGRDTRRYLRRTMWSISLFSATIMGACILVPLLLQLKGDVDATLAMLPTSVMMLTSFWCIIYREIVSIQKYDSCKPLF